VSGGGPGPFLAQRRGGAEKRSWKEHPDWQDMNFLSDFSTRCYPALEKDDIRAAMAYAAELARDRYVAFAV